MKKLLKKFTAFILVLSFISILLQNKYNIITQASETPVKMYYFDNVYSSRGVMEYNVYIQINSDSAYNKSVYVHYCDVYGNWYDEKAEYITKTDSNTEIWKATVKGNITNAEYAIKYIGDGRTYWDNNNGNNYTIRDVLGQANVKAYRTYFYNANNYVIYSVVKNLAYNKIVKVRYTQDNWNTYKDVNLSYDSSIAENNSEYWSVSLTLDENKMDSFQYCISYEVYGQTYWDNNFGANYDKTFHRYQ